MILSITHGSWAPAIYEIASCISQIPGEEDDVKTRLPGGRGAEQHVAHRHFGFGLQKHAADFGHPPGQVLGHFGLRCDRVAEIVGRAGANCRLGNRFIAFHQNLSHTIPFWLDQYSNSANMVPWVCTSIAASGQTTAQIRQPIQREGSCIRA